MRKEGSPNDFDIVHARATRSASIVYIDRGGNLNILLSSTYLLVLLLGLVIGTPLSYGRFAEIDPQCSSVDDLLLEHFPCLGSALNVDEVSMSKASGLTSPSVDGNTDIHNVANVTEKIVEVLV